jgi:cytidylate kinase
MYRSVTFAALRRGIDPAEAERVARIVEDMELEVRDDGVTVDGVDATIEIRGPEVSRAVSVVAANPAVRAEMVRRQREWVAVREGGVLEGRDIGTVVFPDAELKVYLTADPEVRAQRRSKEVTDLDYETVAADLARRDALDQGREVSPLAEADDAFLLDTTGMTVEEIVDTIAGKLGGDLGHGRSDG